MCITSPLPPAAVESVTDPIYCNVWRTHSAFVHFEDQPVSCMPSKDSRGEGLCQLSLGFSSPPPLLPVIENAFPLFQFLYCVVGGARRCRKIPAKGITGEGPWLHPRLEKSSVCTGATRPGSPAGWQTCWLGVRSKEGEKRDKTPLPPPPAPAPRKKKVRTWSHVLLYSLPGSLYSTCRV